MISRETLEKYELIGMLENVGAIPFYKNFLALTDYVIVKIQECKLLGTECEDYTILLNERNFARNEINRLEEFESDIIDDDKSGKIINPFKNFIKKK